MTDLPNNPAVAPAVTASLGARRTRSFGPWIVAAIVTLATLAVAALGWSPERGLADSLFVAAVSLTVGALIAFVLGRVLPATVLVAAMLWGIHAASIVHQRITDLALHAYDVVTLLQSHAAMEALWNDERHTVLAFGAAALTALMLAGLAWRLDGTRIRRSYALGAALIFAALAWAGAEPREQRVHGEFNYTNHYVTLFFSSWSETAEALWRGSIIEAAPQAPGPVLQIPASCQTASKPPHIILIHEESVVQPSQFPELRYDPRMDSFFRSFDGKIHKMRVETYGGASAMTEFSVLTGLSTFSSGGLRNFIQSVMTGKIRDTLPHALARCGYRNVSVFPLMRSYLSMGRFLAGTGFHQVIDTEDQNAPTPNERDRFYFANALNAMGQHFKASPQPLFVFIETMATHWPYDFAYMPEVEVPGGGPGASAEMHEYLRRLSMARIDYQDMRAQLALRFPGERFLIVHYGDHQPLVTLRLLGLDPNSSVEDVVRSGNDAARITYYAVDAVGYEPAPLPALDTVDVPYLGTVILEAARLPLSDVYRERKRLMMLCEGRYHECPARDEIRAFHRRLIDAGIMDAL